MNIKDIKIGDTLCVPNDGFPMVVVGLHASLDDLNSGTVCLDFEENEGDMWEEEAKNLMPYENKA